MTTLLEKHAEWTSTRDAELRLPEGWLSLVALVWLEPGESATVRFAFGDADFSLADDAGAVAVVGGTWRIVTHNDEVEVEVEV